MKRAIAVGVALTVWMVWAIFSNDPTAPVAILTAAGWAAGVMIWTT